MSWNSRMFGRKNEEDKVKKEDVFGSNDWKIRKEGYQAAAADFKKPDLRGKNWDLFNQLVKNLMAEKNVPALEKGLEAVLAFVENCSIVDEEVVKTALNHFVKKGLSDTKPHIRELANQICMALYDRKKHEMVTEMLLQGMGARNSKQALSCVRTVTNALMDYGPSIIHVPAVANKAVALCQDKAMFQQDVKDLLRGIYKLEGPDAKERYMKSLDGPQLKAMEIEFAKVDSERKRSTYHQESSKNVGPHWSSFDKPKSARPTLQQKPSKNDRPSSTSQVIKKERLCSPKSRNTNTSSKKVSDQGCGDRPNRRTQGSPAVRMELDDIFKMMQNKEWGERKDAIEELYTRIISTKTISDFDFGRMIKRLRVLILEDTNVVLVSKAIKCVAALAKTHDKEFQQHAPLMVILLLEKFKDKKGIVIDAVREAIDAIYANSQFGSMARYVALSLMSTHPSVKAETAFFVQRCFARPISGLQKVNHWQPLVQGLVNNLSFPDQVVRENSMKALGTILNTVGNESLATYVNKIPKHQLSSILKYSSIAEVESLRSTSCTVSANIDSDSEHFTSIRSTTDSNSNCPKVFTLLPGGKVRRRSPLNSLDDPGGSVQNETDAESHFSNTSGSPATSPSRPDSSGRPLSPAARERLAGFTTVINQLKQAWKNVQQQQPQAPLLTENLQDSSGTTEEQISRKLRDLEEIVRNCFGEIQQLSPKLYEELECSDNRNRGEVINRLNQRLNEMERLLKAMAFEIRA